ncbi:MAG: hypothetical protein RsTaC01_0918 [Candidatus Paraimprobicoccus trichonymphae]|uniref:Uncharacterized protein n=1 Tax=Candidatus Paraimprobicoccus trichonymphae TaxID=3033793 RepID=A0AA48IHJ7_9FIRM|nr:MAG: hypothetical protein RsTaC01_0918 [Candidatus Paraimprobicoccus trichonymphae]
MGKRYSGYAVPFDENYAKSIFTGGCGSTAFSPLFSKIFSNNNCHGNIWIKLSGAYKNHDNDGIIGDFSKADAAAKNYGLFTQRPENYVWYHVFMGWFDYENFLSEDINELQCLSTENLLNTLNTEKIEIIQGAYRNKNTEIYDARSWTNCFKKDFDKTNWIPDEDHYSLIQLIPIEFTYKLDNEEYYSLNNVNNSAYYSSCNQYQTYFQSINVYKKYYYNDN